MEMKELLKKVEKLKKEELDLSSDEDLSIAVMNLISIEEHLYFSGMKTSKKLYFDLLKEVREMRKELLKDLLKKPEGEEWCISKHLLACSMRLIEVGNKYLNKDKKKAEEMFVRAFDLYSLFWSLNLKLISSDEIIKKEEKDKWSKKLSGIVKKLIDCCKE